jgi:hypothetical protein
MTLVPLIVALGCTGAAAVPSRPAPVCAAPRGLAEQYRRDVAANNAGSLLALFGDGTLVCMDAFVPKAEIAKSIRSPGMVVNALLFDGVRLRSKPELSDYGTESLAEFFSNKQFRVSIRDEGPGPGSTARACIAYEDKERKHEFCAKCVNGAWVIYDWSYACFVGL